MTRRASFPLLLCFFFIFAFAEHPAWHQEMRDGSNSCSVDLPANPSEFTFPVEGNKDSKLYVHKLGVILTNEDNFYLIPYNTYGSTHQLEGRGAKELCIDEQGHIYRVAPAGFGQYYIEKFALASDRNHTKLWSVGPYRNVQGLMYMAPRIYFRARVPPTMQYSWVTLVADTGRKLFDHTPSFTNPTVRVAPQAGLILMRYPHINELQAWEADLSKVRWVQRLPIEEFVVNEKVGQVIVSTTDSERFPRVHAIDLASGRLVAMSEQLTRRLAANIKQMAATPEGNVALQADVGPFHPDLHMFGLAGSQLDFHWQDPQELQYPSAAQPVALPNGDVALFKNLPKSRFALARYNSHGHTIQHWSGEVNAPVTQLVGAADALFFFDGTHVRAMPFHWNARA